jgi:hypothetical protein
MKRMLCVGAVAFVVLLLAQLPAQRRAQASVYEAILGLGDAMAPYLDDKRTTESPRRMMVNGQPLYVAVGRTAHRPEQVASWYADRYRGSGEALGEIARRVPGAPAAPPTEMTFGDDDSGGLVAFDLGTPSAADLARRFQKFTRTHSLGELGQMRFVRWTREADGGTRFLTAWTDKRFSLDRLLPPPGTDVGGGDLPDVARPAGMTRVLALEEAGRPYHTRVYEGAGSVSGVAAELAAAMRQRGWVGDDSYERAAPDTSAGAGAGTQLRFGRDGRSVVYAVDETERGLIDVAVVESGS